MNRLRRVPILFVAIALVAFAALTPGIAAGQDVIINEVFYRGFTGDDWVELKNVGSSTINVSSWWLCARFTYRPLSGLTNLDGTDLVLSPGEITTVQMNFDLGGASSDLGLYTSTSFGTPSEMRDFVQWGGSGIGRENVAAAAGLWTAGDFVLAAKGSQSMAYNGGDPNASGGYENGPPTRSEENITVPVSESTWGRVKSLYQ